MPHAIKAGFNFHTCTIKVMRLFQTSKVGYGAQLTTSLCLFISADALIIVRSFKKNIIETLFYKYVQLAF